MDKHSINSRVPSTKKAKLDFDSFNDIYFKRFIAGFMILIIIGLGFAGYKINEFRTRGYEVFIGNTSLGYVRDEGVAVALLNDYNKNLTNTYDVEIMFEEDLSFEPINIKDESIITTTQLKRNIQSEANFLVSAYAISIDGEQIGVVESQEEAIAILDEIKEPFTSNTDENATLMAAEFREEVEITGADVDIEDLGEKNQIVEDIRTGGEETKAHTVEAGESFWTIAKIHDMPVDDLIAANPGIEEKDLKPGDAVSISVPISQTTVVTTEEVLTTENIDYEVIVEHDDTMWEDEQTIKVEGKPGKANITSHQIKHNGSLVDTEIKLEEVIEEPVDQVVIQGTKERPKTMATGSFMVPTRGRVSSGYGMRWGRMHRGLDIAGPVGTPIYASDGGVVTHSGQRGAYGYMVEIDHENGYKTRYAHASKMHVSVGTRVYKGQHIADIGNTGRSTGPHLHFEVLKNGSQQNPSGFIY